MNLSSLQYMDINNAITTVVNVRCYPTYSTLLRHSDGLHEARQVVIESGRRRRERLPGNSHCSDPGQDPLPLLEAWPIFPNSLLSTEIAVNLPGLDESVLPQCGQPGSVGQRRGELDFPVDTNLHYRLQEPLPGYLGGLLYRAGSHAVVILDDVEQLSHTDSALIHELHVTLNADRYRGRQPREVMIPHFLDSDNSAGGALESCRRGSVMVELYRLSNLCHRLNVIGKADMVLSDSSGIAVDAIRSSVPAAFVTGTPRGFEAMQDCVNRFLQHHDRQQLLAEQQSVLDDMLARAGTNYRVMSNQPTLQSLMRARLGAIDTRASHDPLPASSNTPVAADPSSSGLEASADEALILRTQQTLCCRVNKSVRLKSGIESSRRKFQKFKESPTRFMEDSQSVILRSLVSGRGPR